MPETLYEIQFSGDFFVVIEFLQSHIKLTICVLILVSRIGDILSTMLITPKMNLEMNLIAAKLGKPFMVATVLLCLLPFFDLTAGVLILFPSLFIAAQNFRSLWSVRTTGEEAYYQNLLALIKKSSFKQYLPSLFLQVLFNLIAAFSIIIFYPNGTQWGFWIGMSIVLYALIIFIHSINFYFRLFKRAHAQTTT